MPRTLGESLIHVDGRLGITTPQHHLADGVLSEDFAAEQRAVRAVDLEAGRRLRREGIVDETTTPLRILIAP
jgi:hypothetical protein